MNFDNIFKNDKNLEKTLANILEDLNLFLNTSNSKNDKCVVLKEKIINLKFIYLNYIRREIFLLHIL
jgi:hypothetical protein